MSGSNDIKAFDFILERLTGGPLALKDYAGHPLLIVNTASKCGFTPQYKGLEKLWRERRDRGLIILGVPSNDFGGQEPGNATEIASFCEINYGVDFPMAGKVHVKGAETHPLFRWLATQGGFLSKPRWNFYKYLIGPDGSLKTWFSSITKPQSARLAGAIDEIIGR